MKPNIPGSVGARRASVKLNPLDGVVDDVVAAFSGSKKGLNLLSPNKSNRKPNRLGS